MAHAADRVHVSATAVAGGITALEQALKVKLIQRRKSHGTTLTTDGQNFYVEAKKILEMSEEAELSLAGGGRELVGPLAVGCFPTMAPTLLPAISEYFGTSHPRVSLNFSIKTQHQLIQQLIAREVDCVVLYDMYLPEGLRKTPLHQAAVHILISASHPLAHRTSVSLKEMEGDPLVLFDSDPASTHSFSIFNRAGIQPHIRYRGTEYELIRSMVARNLGYSLMIHRPAHNYSYEGLELVAMPIRPALPLEDIVAVWPENTILNPRAQELVRVAAQVLQGQSAIED